jgi:diacylglycerol kinase family enzyme
MPPIPAFVNASAGTAAAAVAALAETEDFAAREIEAPEISDAIREAVAAGATRVLVAGGDGTVCSAASVLVGTPVELAVLPGGTLNHFAKDHGIPDDAAAAAAVATGGVTVGADVAYVNERMFLNTSSAGAYVLFVRARERLERFVGYRAATLLAGLRVLATLPSFHVEVEVDGVTRHYATPIVFVGVGERELRLPSLGARVPGGRRALHVMVVRGRTRAALLAFAFAAAARSTKRVARTPKLDAFLVDRCRITMRRPYGRVAVDGEVEMMKAPLEFRIARGALQLVVPRPAADAVQGEATHGEATPGETAPRPAAPEDARAVEAAPGERSR